MSSVSEYIYEYILTSEKYVNILEFIDAHEGDFSNYDEITDLILYGFTGATSISEDLDENEIWDKHKFILDELFSWNANIEYENDPEYEKFIADFKKQYNDLCKTYPAYLTMKKILNKANYYLNVNYPDENKNESD